MSKCILTTQSQLIVKTFFIKAKAWKCKNKKLFLLRIKKGLFWKMKKFKDVKSKLPNNAKTAEN